MECDDTYEPTEAAKKTARSWQWVPGDDGSLQIEMHTGDADIEIDIAPDGRVKAVLFERAD